jgi:hypothetical protein
MPQYLVKPTNSVLVQGPHSIVEMKVGANATLAKMLPKRVVIYDAADGAVKEAGDASAAAIGVLMELPDQGIATAYIALGDPCRVVTKGIVLCTFASAAAGCTPGQKIVAAADGKVKASAAAADVTLGKALTTVAAGGPDADVIVELW